MKKEKLEIKIGELKQKANLVGGHMFSAFGSFCIFDIDQGSKNAEEAGKALEGLISSLEELEADI